MKRKLIIAIYLAIMTASFVIAYSHYIHCTEQPAVRTHEWLACAGHFTLFLAECILFLVLVVADFDGHHDLPPHRKASDE